MGWAIWNECWKSIGIIVEEEHLSLATEMVAMVCAAAAERVTGRKARGLQMEEIGCKCQTFLSLLSTGGNKRNIFFFLLYTNLKGGFSENVVLP